MIRVALTGGIGSGKSTVAALLRDHGALVIDADHVARDIVAPGEPALAEIVERFGAGVLGADGALDRAGLAAIVFKDPEALAALNAITHPRIAARTAELMAAAPDDAVMVYDMPLLVEQGIAQGWDHVIVVEAPLELRVQRLVARGLAESDARARIAAQATDEQRRAVADTLIVNDAGLAQVRERVTRLWQELAS